MRSISFAAKCCYNIFSYQRKRDGFRTCDNVPIIVTNIPLFSCLPYPFFFILFIILSSLVFPFILIVAPVPSFFFFCPLASCCNLTSLLNASNSSICLFVFFSTAIRTRPFPYSSGFNSEREHLRCYNNAARSRPSGSK